MSEEERKIVKYQIKQLVCGLSPKEKPVAKNKTPDSELAGERCFFADKTAGFIKTDNQSLFCLSRIIFDYDIIVVWFSILSYPKHKNKINISCH